MAPQVRYQAVTGERHGNLVILGEERVPLTPGRASHGFTSGVRGARCLCDCGNEIVIALAHLRGLASVQSCGCLRRKQIALPPHAVPGLARPAGKKTLRSTWRSMMSRCYDQRHYGYACCGGLGITVCNEWHEVKVFTVDIMRLIGPRPDSYVLSRIDLSEGYDLGNVRWASWGMLNSLRNSPRSRITPDRVLTARKMRSEGANINDIAVAVNMGASTVRHLTRDLNTAPRPAAHASSGRSW